MLISFDTRTYIYSRLSKIKSDNSYKNNLFNKFNFFYKGTSGPKKAVSDLIIAIDNNNLAKTTFNFLSSDVHILNAGFYSPLWSRFQPKQKEKVLIRLDGIGIDSEGINFKKLNLEFVKLFEKGSSLVYQSKFSKNCFSSAFKSLPESKVIYNGASELINDPKINQFTRIIRSRFGNGYFTVAGRFTKRKRIYEIINEFQKFDLGNLVVLSNVPENLKKRSKKILYLGMINPDFARNIINNSLALIHFDRYDWCPNIVVAAVNDGVPVICSNFGGTPEIVGENGLIIEEFPKNLPHSLDGINFAKRSPFPSKIFRDNISDINWIKGIKKRTEFFNIKKMANEYVKFANYLIK
jgi:glycosyltransferase involved in cell wall biosynthesis